MLAWGSASAANDLVPSITLQTGATFTRTPGAGNDTNGYFVAATPTLMYFVEGERSLLSLTYSFTGSLDTNLPNGIANRLAIVTTHDLDPRTRLQVGGEALQALIGNYLLVRRADATQIGALPPLNTSLMTLGVNQGLSHELTPRLTLNQTVSGTFVTSLDPDVELRNYLATGSISVERAWQFDALGAELGVQYARSFLPPAPEVQFVTAALGPTWDHDVTTKLSTSLSVAAQVALDPDGRGKTLIGPAARASAFYVSEGSGIGLEYTGGIEPNLLLGTLFQSQSVTLRGFTPISVRHNVMLGLSSGYLYAKNVDLGQSRLLDNTFDAVLHDADITWAATDFLSVFIRYQFIGQSAGTGTGATPALVRHGALIGVDLFAARPPPRQRLPKNGFSKRVDGSDSQQLGRSPANSSFGSGSKGSGGAGPGGAGGPQRSR